MNSESLPVWSPLRLDGIRGLIRRLLVCLWSSTLHNEHRDNVLQLSDTIIFFKKNKKLVKCCKQWNSLSGAGEMWWNKRPRFSQQITEQSECTWGLVAFQIYRSRCFPPLSLSLLLLLSFFFSFFFCKILLSNICFSMRGHVSASSLPHCSRLVPSHFLFCFAFASAPTRPAVHSSPEHSASSLLPNL